MLCGPPNGRPTFHLPSSLISPLLDFHLPACFVSPYPLQPLRHPSGPVQNVFTDPYIRPECGHPLGQRIRFRLNLGGFLGFRCLFKLILQLPPPRDQRLQFLLLLYPQRIQLHICQDMIVMEEPQFPVVPIQIPQLLPQQEVHLLQRLRALFEHTQPVAVVEV